MVDGTPAKGNHEKISLIHSGKSLQKKKVLAKKLFSSANLPKQGRRKGLKSGFNEFLQTRQILNANPCYITADTLHQTRQHILRADFHKGFCTIRNHRLN